MEFIKGADLSSLLEVERCGGLFRDGAAPEDALAIFRRYGVNWVRLRLWNDPYDGAGNDYGAGVCDLPAVLTLARRAKNAGMSWLLDLHYSDFWADPGKQTTPKAWQNLDEAGLEAAVYRYTRDVLCACRAAGVEPEMVQVGNELTNGLLWPTGRAPNWETICRYVTAGVQAVREEAPAARVMVHLDNGGSHELYREWFDHYFRLGGDCDVIGLSYYPFWHGTLGDLSANMNDIAPRYGKDLVVAETSMGFTMDSFAAWEGRSEDQRKGPATRPELVEKVPYPMSPDGQAAFIRDLMAAIAAVPGGQGAGFFWWEPAWIPVPGSGWAKQSGWEYVRERGPEGHEWANQTLFDFDGNALPALGVIRDFVPLPRSLAVNGTDYRILRLLGKGKGGYSYLAEGPLGPVVLKQLHHERCDYYRFGDKLAAELRDYERLRALDIPLPELLAVDRAAERLVKTYIPGPTVYELVLEEALPPACAVQAEAMAEKLREAGLNIDWFPTNFIPWEGTLWYVDYECNDYMERWDFPHWGRTYWSRTPELLAHAAGREREAT